MMSAIPLREPSSHCIGRDKELSFLKRRFEEASRWGERFTLIRGPAGVGKTKLMVEFRSQLRLEGAVVLEGRCTSGARALAPLREILKRALDFLEEVGRAGEVDVSPLAFLLGDGAPVENDAQGMTKLEQRVAFFEAYCSLLRELSRVKPPIILVHDLQWADTATIELLAHLMDGVGPWMDDPQSPQTLLGLVVASVREGEEPAAVTQLVSHPKVQTIDLQGFDEEAMTQFLQTPTVVDRLLRATGGNPEEVLAILDSPTLGADRMLEKRLETLDTESKMLLASLGILGRPSEVSLVARVAGLTNVAKPLSALLERKLVVKSVHEGEIVLRPSRHRYGDIMCESLVETERVKLHSRVVEAFKGARGLAAQDVAYHAVRAGERDTAVEAALEAATALESTFAYEAATGLLEEARRLASEGQVVELDRRLSDLYTHVGSYELALQRAEGILRAQPGAFDSRLRVGRLQALAGDYDAASMTLAELEVPEGETGDEALMAELMAVKAEVAFRKGDYDEALEFCQHESEGTNSAALLALRNTKGKILLARGEYPSAQKTFGENLTRARQSELVREQAQSLINLGIVHLREHQHEEATKRLDEALELARRAGALRESAIALENLAVLAHFRRDFGRALDCYHSAVADLKRLGNRSMLARAANNLGELYLQLGDHKRASMLADFAHHVAGDDPPQSIVAEGLLLRARVAMRRDSSSEARSALEQAVSIFSRLGERNRHVEAELALARLDLDRGDVTGAKTRLKTIRGGGGLDHVRRGEAALIESEIERSNFGNPLRAVLVAIDCFEQAHDPERSWRAHLRAATFSREAKDRSGWRRHLERAATIEAKVSATVPASFAEPLGNDPDRVRLREALGELTGDPLPSPAHPYPKSSDVSVAPSEKPAGSAPDPLDRVIGRDPVVSAQFPDIVFESEAIHGVLQLVQKVAPTDSIVLIRGESGTGKELVADAIHRLSDRRKHPFVKVNCAALVETLLLSELFGHEKGAFTGAMQRRKGRFEAADSGTLFLDEIGDISPKTQVSLLRVLQEQQFERVGGSKPIRTNVRIICATNRNLEELVREGTFREDLYYRLKGIQISLPPLRDRHGDIEVLSSHFLNRMANERNEPLLTLSKGALDLLSGHGWPGNVRELENVIRSASLFVDGPVLDERHIAEFTELQPIRRDASPPPPPPDARSTAPPPALDSTPPPPTNLRVEDVPPLDGLCDEVVSGDLSLAEMKKKLEIQCIEEALHRTNGNITQAASLLGMKRPRLSQLVKEHGLLQRERRVKS